MHPVLRFLLKVKPNFAPGGRLEKMHPVYEATETFLFTPPDVTDGPPHVRDALDNKRYMIAVAVALLPCFLFGMYNAGLQYNIASQLADAGFWSHLWEGFKRVMPILLVSYAAGGFWEVLFAAVRKHDINEGFLVTGLLFPLTLPPTIPLWQVAVGISFGVVIGKEIFGGVGFNVLNPALTARCFLYFAYPGQISGDKVWVATPVAEKLADGFSGATALSVAKATPAGSSVFEHLAAAGHTLKSMVLGLEGGSIGETSVIAILFGAAVLLVTGVGAWRIMAGGVLGVAAVGSLVNAIGGPAVQAIPMFALPFWYDLAMGGVLFGLVFMATDPVSAAATNTGKWIYGFLIGALTVVVRMFNPAYPAGNMLAILFMNVMAPLIDYFVLQAHIRARARYLESFSRAQG